MTWQRHMQDLLLALAFIAFGSALAAALGWLGYDGVDVDL